MKYIKFVVLMIFFTLAKAEEVCVDEEKYESLIKSIELVLQTTYQFDGHLSYIEGYILARRYIDKKTHGEYLEVMDDLMDRKFSLLISSLPILNIEKSKFDEKYKYRIIRLAVDTRESLKELKSSAGLESMEVFLHSLDYFDEYESTKAEN